MLKKYSADISFMFSLVVNLKYLDFFLGIVFSLSGRFGEFSVFIYVVECLHSYMKSF